MLFSTRAEYGVRLMVELGRQDGEAPGRAERGRRVRAPAPLLPRAPGRQAAQGRSGREPARRPRRLPPGPPRRRDRDARGGPGARGRDRADGVLPSRPRGQGLLLARERRRPRLRHQASLDAGAGRGHQGARRHHARRAGRVLRPARARTARPSRPRSPRHSDNFNRTRSTNWQSSRSATCT